MTDDAYQLSQQIERLALPICEELGLGLYDLIVGRHGTKGTVRVFIERVDATGAGTGVTMGEITSVTKQLGYLLDAEDVVPFEYRFEVSSPGVERHLRTPEHFLRAVGHDVRIVCDPADVPHGGGVVEGTLAGADAHTATVRVAPRKKGEEGVDVEVPIDAVRRAKTRYEFTKPRRGKSGGPTT